MAELTPEQLSEVLYSVEKASHLSVAEAAVKISAIGAIGFIGYTALRLFSKNGPVKK